jgi:hypothetical protein
MYQMNKFPSRAQRAAAADRAPAPSRGASGPAQKRILKKNAPRYLSAPPISSNSSSAVSAVSGRLIAFSGLPVRNLKAN